MLTFSNNFCCCCCCFLPIDNIVDATLGDYTSFWYAKSKPRTLCVMTFSLPWKRFKKYTIFLFIYINHSIMTRYTWKGIFYNISRVSKIVFISTLIFAAFSFVELWILFWLLSSHHLCCCCILCRTHVCIESLRRVIWNESSYANGPYAVTTSEKRISFLWRWINTPNKNKQTNKKNAFTWLFFISLSNRCRESA